MGFKSNKKLSKSLIIINKKIRESQVISHKNKVVFVKQIYNYFLKVSYWLISSDILYFMFWESTSKFSFQSHPILKMNLCFQRFVNNHTKFYFDNFYLKETTQLFYVCVGNFDSKDIR